MELFSACSARELRRIDRLTCEIAVPAGAPLVVEGQPGRECFVVVEGRGIVTRDGARIGEVGPGSIVGELALLDGTPRSATVTAGSPMRVLVLHAGEFGQMLDAAPRAAEKVRRAAAERRATRPAADALRRPA